MTATDFRAIDGKVIDPWGVAYTPDEMTFRVKVMAEVALDPDYDDEFAEVGIHRISEAIRASREAARQSQTEERKAA